MTTFDPLSSDKPLIIYVDIKSPYAFIAKDPTWAFADELGIEIDWRPLTLDIPSYLGSAKLDKSGKVAQSNRSAQQWGGVRYAYMDARRYAAAYGYALRGTEKIWNTRLIHIAFMWVKRDGDAALRKFIDAVYPPFWVRDLDVEDEQVVVRCIEQAGVASDGFLQWAAAEGGAAHDEQQAAIFSAGIYGVPGYIHEGEYFFGREHLPRLRSLILAKRTNGVADPTDIANPLPPFAVVARNASDEKSKAVVFQAMQRAASDGRLSITAGVNPECIESVLASRTLQSLQAAHPGKLQVRWAHLPCRSLGAVPLPKESAQRGERHRAFRTRYEIAEQGRSRQLHSDLVDAQAGGAGEFIDWPIDDSSAVAQLQENGVGFSFGFVFEDEQGVMHPFNGRQHLSVLGWALS